MKADDLVYNIADEYSKTTIKQLAEVLVTMKPEKGLKLVFDIPEGGQKGVAAFKNGILATDKIRNELRWCPRYGIKEGFERTVSHLKEELKIKKNKVLKQ